MADEKYKSVSTFALPDEYQRQASEARRRRRIAEMLAQQEYQPGNIQNAPIPRGAPLVQGLQAYLSARAGRKADEAEESAMKAQTQEARDFLNTLTRPREDFDKTMNLKEALQLGTPELVDGQLQYPDMTASSLKMIPQAGPQVQLGRKPEDDQVYMPTAVSRFTATGRETDPQRMAEMLANPQFKSGFTDEQLLKQRLNLTREAMLTSQNPMLQKVAGAIYPTLQPEKTKLSVGAVDLSKLTPASAKRFAVSGDPEDIEYRADPGATPTNLARLLSEFNALPENDPRRVSYQRAIDKETRIPGPTVVNTGDRTGPLEYVVGPNGKPMLVPRSQAVGKERAAPPQAARVGPTGDSSTDKRQYRTSKRELQNAYNVVNDFLQALKTTPKEESFVGEKAGELSSKYKLALGAIRTLQNTGVLNPGELPFIEDTLRDPQKISQLFNPSSRETIFGQINAISDSLESQSTTLDESYGYDAVPLRGSETRRANRVPAAAAAAGITQQEWDNSTEEERKPWR